jgi:CRP-like cAMP-binding protein
MSQDKIIEYARKFIPLSDEEALEFSAPFKEVKIRKRQFIVQPGFVATSRWFVIEGALRAYVVGEDGRDYTIKLAIEGWWITDFNSYIFQRPANMFVVAMEDCVLLRLGFEEEKKLKAQNYSYETFFRILAERATASMLRQITMNLTQTAEQRYNYFMEKYPLMAERLPQYVIASYLGMTTEFLSKIRNQKVRRKT